jgi:hypothetical protein
MRKLVGVALALSAMTGIARADAVVFDDGTLDRITAGAPSLFIGSVPASALPLLAAFGLAPAPSSAEPEVVIDPIPAFGPIPESQGGKTTYGPGGTFATCASAGTCTNTVIATPTSILVKSTGSVSGRL